MSQRKIYYTTDGSDPTSSSTLYTGPIAITQDVQIRAIAICGSESSQIVKGNFTVLPPVENALVNINRATAKVYPLVIAEVMADVSAVESSASFSVLPLQRPVIELNMVGSEVTFASAIIASASEMPVIQAVTSSTIAEIV